MREIRILITIVVVFLSLFIGLSVATIELAKEYELKAEKSYKQANDNYIKQEYIKSLVSYVEAITYYTLAYHIYIDKYNDKVNFFRVSEIVLKVSLESDEVSLKALEQAKNVEKKNNILNIKSSNYLNFASTLQKMYGVDYKIATQKYDELRKKLETEDSIIVSIAKYFAKSIDIQLSVNNYDKAKEYFQELNKYYQTLDNRIRDKFAVKKIVDFYKAKVSK
ncbi:MAG: hypothetical protein ABDH21_03800 [bacterium]